MRIFWNAICHIINSGTKQQFSFTDKYQLKYMLYCLLGERDRDCIGQNILQSRQIHLSIWTNTFINLDKYILQFGQMHFVIWTNIIEK